MQHKDKIVSHIYAATGFPVFIARDSTEIEKRFLNSVFKQ